MDVAEVKIWGELVGAVAWDASTELASFEFDSKFQALNWDLSPLKMPVKNAILPFSFPEPLPMVAIRCQ